MPKAAKIGRTLKLSLFLSGKRQKELAIDASTPNATVSDHFNGANVNIDKAIEYLEAMRENGYQATDELTGDISYQYLGFFKSMDGQLADVKSTNDLEIFQEIESNERKERKKVVQRIVAESQVRMLTDVERTELRNYTDLLTNEVNRSNISINGRNNSVNQGNNQQSKEKESKEKEIKEDAIASESASLETFQKLWLFPNVVQVEDLLNLVNIYGDELVEAAIKLAGSKDVPKNRAISFLTASLQEWADANVKTIDQARDYQRTRGAKKQGYNQKPLREEKLPDWAVNEQGEEQLSPERQAELDAKLAAYLNKTKH